MAIVVFGLTGGIGSGKSTVARHLRSRGLPVIDADVLAREAVAKGSEGLGEVVRAFGPDVLQADGSLDRARLAQRVFASKEALARLEAITHPRVRALARARVDALDQGGEPLVCYEVPLLYEVGLEREYAPVVVVSVPEALQLERAVLRDATNADSIRRRMAAQLPLDEKVRRADFVIDNSGTLDDTREQTDRVLARICERFGVDPKRYGL